MLSLPKRILLLAILAIIRCRQCRICASSHKCRKHGPFSTLLGRDARHTLLLQYDTLGSLPHGVTANGDSRKCLGFPMDLDHRLGAEDITVSAVIHDHFDKASAISPRLHIATSLPQSTTKLLPSSTLSTHFKINFLIIIKIEDKNCTNNE